MLELYVRSTREFIISILKARLREVKSFVQLGYTGGLGTGQDIETSEPRGIKTRTLGVGLMPAPACTVPHSSARCLSRSRAGGFKAGTGLQRQWQGSW